MPELLSAPSWWLVAAAALALTGVVVWVLRRAASREPVRDREGQVGLHGGYLVATVVIAAVALALILVAFTMSYAALYQAATWLADTQLRAINDGDLRFLFPLGIDAVIVYFLAMDLLMEWQGRRHALNRWAAYALSAITIVLNVSQGQGTTASYLGHAGPPIVIILIAEGVAAWIRHLAGLAHGQAADRIPFGRWVAHPLSTLKVARLMLGWGVASYPEALGREQRRQLAYAMLREQYGRAWRRHTPRHLRWMLDNGYELDVAFELTRAMTAATVAMTADEVATLGQGVGQDMATVARGEGEVATEPGHGLATAVQTPEAEPGQPAALPVDVATQVGQMANAAETQLANVGQPAAHPVDVATQDGQMANAWEHDQTSMPATDSVAQHAREEAAVPDEDEHEPGGESTEEADPFSAPTGPLSPGQKRARVRELLDQHPGMSDGELAARIGAAPRTARRYRSEILSQPTSVDTGRPDPGRPVAVGDGQEADLASVMARN
ncbi:DUF2637 domain-containing protein [Nocardiopsis sp. NPDC050513]|uniref:DUF2637 domain-containing protein n=1 Tax=Nocardiopsis sp. NPDC050513 TaxID=3364338 RepID=UPI0037959497